jgi:glycosyltransferase involved in cell wall biosynthesis
MKMSDFLSSLTGFNRLRLDACLVRIQNRPPLMLMFNIGLVMLNSIFRLKPLYLSFRARFSLSSREPSLNMLLEKTKPERNEIVMPAERPSILLVVEDSIPQCYRYRVQQKVDQAKPFACHLQVVPWQNGKKARQLMHFAHVVIFYRVPAFPEVIHLFNQARALKRLVFYDVDDLVFDRLQLEEKFKHKDEHISNKDLSELFTGADLYRHAMELSSFGIASTPALAAEMQKHVAAGRCFVHRNALDEVLLELALHPPQKIKRPYTTIFYGSGTKTHDSDLQMVAAPIARLMQKYPSLRITLAGTVRLPEELARHASRVDQIGILDVEPYLEVLAQADINIAPLEPGLFADTKSEIKWLEAAVSAVPSVVSRTRTYDEILMDSIDAMLANTPSEWYDKLELLITDRNLRKNIGSNARSKALKSYLPQSMTENLKEIIKQAAQEDRTVRVVAAGEKKKWKLLYVNVLYPPKGGGGATIVVESIIEQMRKNYHRDFEIIVFTYDPFRTQPYEIEAYLHNGVAITALSIPIRPNFDWEYRDDTVEEIFQKYLEFEQPDLIHFHSVQRLTASTVSVARNMGIPYLVTVHDAWWISDYQFMVDEDGGVCDYQQNDPLVLMCTRTGGDLNATMHRGRYLRKLLNAAETVLAVSEFQAALHKKNGIQHIRLNKNGVGLQNWLPRTPSSNGLLRLGYLGGISAHKGYYLLKEAIQQAQLTNCELSVVDHARGQKHKKEKWGGTEVTYIPTLKNDRMPEFYGSIDVLVAPSICPESFGLTTREAKLAGVWVVAANAGGLAEDVDEGINGNVFEAGNAEELALVLRQIDRKPENYLHVSFDSQKVTVPTVAAQVEELNTIYRKIILTNATEEEER